MYSKAFLLLALTSLACSHDVIEGSNNTAARIIYDDHLQASPAIWKQTSDVTVNASEHGVISKINITDLRPDKDGDAQIVAGGVGQNNVTITIKSPTILRGYDFFIQVQSVDESQMDTAELGITNNTQHSDVTTEPQLSTARNGPTIVTRPAEVTDRTGNPKELTESVSTGKPTEEVSDSTDKPAEVSVSTNTPAVVSDATDKPKTKDLAASEPTETLTETTTGGSDAMENEAPVEIEHQPKLQSFVGFKPPHRPR